MAFSAFMTVPCLRIYERNGGNGLWDKPHSPSVFALSAPTEYSVLIRIIVSLIYLNLTPTVMEHAILYQDVAF